MCTRCTWPDGELLGVQLCADSGLPAVQGLQAPPYEHVKAILEAGASRLIGVICLQNLQSFVWGNHLARRRKNCG
uniref:Uncharacterized protein n=1 Tax=Arundo donax TaxID=35708 RepID=A0A0A9A728_ARUDO